MHLPRRSGTGPGGPAGGAGTFQDDGITLDDPRRLNVFDIDANTTIPLLKTYIVGEWAWVNVDVPDTYSQQFGEKQHGGFVDLVQPVVRRRMLGFDKAVVNVALRLEYVDWNDGVFEETGG